MRLLAIPERRPEIVAGVIILGNAASEATTVHKTIATDPLQTVGESLADVQQYRGIFPDTLQTIRGCVPEDEIRHRLPDAAQGV